MSGGEMIVIALVALLVLGPQKMSEAARKAGKMMSEVRRVSSDFTSQLNEETS
jgi:sec-independent protein translocase protein TatB